MFHDHGLERHCKRHTHVNSRLYSTKKKLRNVEKERKLIFYTRRLLTILSHKKVIILQTTSTESDRAGSFIGVIKPIYQINVCMYVFGTVTLSTEYLPIPTRENGKYQRGKKRENESLVSCNVLMWDQLLLETPEKTALTLKPTRREILFGQIFFRNPGIINKIWWKTTVETQ